MKKFKSIIIPDSEESVRHLFSLHAKDLGFEILNIQKTFPDCTAIDLREEPAKEVDIEIEFDSSNFISHGHKEQMLQNREYKIVCWTSRNRNGIPPNVEIIELEDKFKIVSKVEKDIASNIEEPIYRIISYNHEKNGQPIEIWEEIKIFRTNTKFKDNMLPKGSVIVLHSKGKLVGEFTVAKYHYIENPPSNRKEKKFYELSAFPIGFSHQPSNRKNCDWLRGHIVYYNFRKYDPPVPLAILGKKLSGFGRRNLSHEELQMIRGKRNLNKLVA
jgi:hypothetical protein